MSQLKAIPALTLPAIGAACMGGFYEGVMTSPEGEPYVFITLADQPPKRASYDTQMDWAQSLGADLLTPAEAAHLIATGRFPKAWVWLNKAEGSACAWLCHSTGGQYCHSRSASGGGVAVRRFPLHSFNPSGASEGAAVGEASAVEPQAA